MDDCFFYVPLYGLFWIFRGSLKAEWAVLSPSNKVAAMPEDAAANGMPLFYSISAKIKEMSSTRCIQEQ